MWLDLNFLNNKDYMEKWSQKAFPLNSWKENNVFACVFIIIIIFFQCRCLNLFILETIHMKYIIFYPWI